MPKLTLSYQALVVLLKPLGMDLRTCMGASAFSPIFSSSSCIPYSQLGMPPVATVHSTASGSVVIHLMNSQAQSLFLELLAMAML